MPVNDLIGKFKSELATSIAEQKFELNEDRKITNAVFQDFLKDNEFEANTFYKNTNHKKIINSLKRGISEIFNHKEQPITSITCEKYKSCCLIPGIRNKITILQNEIKKVIKLNQTSSFSMEFKCDRVHEKTIQSLIECVKRDIFKDILKSIASDSSTIKAENLQMLYICEILAIMEKELGYLPKVNNQYSTFCKTRAGIYQQSAFSRNPFELLKGQINYPEKEHNSFNRTMKIEEAQKPFEDNNVDYENPFYNFKHPKKNGKMHVWSFPKSQMEINRNKGSLLSTINKVEDSNSIVKTKNVKVKASLQSCEEELKKGDKKNLSSNRNVKLPFDKKNLSSFVNSYSLKVEPKNNSFYRKCIGLESFSYLESLIKENEINDKKSNESNSNVNLIEKNTNKSNVNHSSKNCDSLLSHFTAKASSTKADSFDNSCDLNFGHTSRVSISLDEIENKIQKQGNSEINISYPHFQLTPTIARKKTLKTLFCKRSPIYERYGTRFSKISVKRKEIKKYPSFSSFSFSNKKNVSLERLSFFPSKSISVINVCQHAFKDVNYKKLFSKIPNETHEEKQIHTTRFEPFVFSSGKSDVGLDFSNNFYETSKQSCIKCYSDHGTINSQISTKHKVTLNDVNNESPLKRDAQTCVSHSLLDVASQITESQDQYKVKNKCNDYSESKTEKEEKNTDSRKTQICFNTNGQLKFLSSTVIIIPSDNKVEYNCKMLPLMEVSWKECAQKLINGE